MISANKLYEKYPILKEEKEIEKSKEVQCPSCGKSFKHTYLKGNILDKQAECPECSNKFEISVDEDIEESIDPTETSDGEEVKVEGEGEVKGDTEKEAIGDEDKKFAKRAAKIPKEPKMLEDGYLYIINKQGKALIAAWNQFQKEAATWFSGDISQNELTEKGNTAAWLTRIAKDKPKFTKQDIIRNGGNDNTEKSIIKYVVKFN